MRLFFFHLSYSGNCTCDGYTIYFAENTYQLFSIPEFIQEINDMTSGIIIRHTSKSSATCFANILFNQLIS